jgi:cell division septal protein FtsQ
MKLERVELKGVDDETRRELIYMAGLHSDLSLLGLKLDELKKRMEEHTWVRSVKLERRLPHTLIVRAERESPSALILSDKIYYMNRYGEIFKEVYEAEEMDFPIITGISVQRGDSQDQLNRATNVMRVLETEKGLWSLDELSEIHVTKDGDISLYFNHLAAEIKLMSEDLSNKMAGLKRVAEHLRQAGRIHQVTHIHLNHTDGALVSFKNG